MSIEYRKATATDNAKLEALNEITSTGELAQYSSKKEGLFDVKEYINKNGCFWVAQDGDQIVGMVGLRMGKERKMKVKALRVHPNYQKQGIARKLMGILEEHCNEHGIQEIILGVNQTSVPAITLYESLGFTRYAEKKFDAENVVFYYRKELL